MAQDCEIPQAFVLQLAKASERTFVRLASPGRRLMKLRLSAYLVFTLSLIFLNSLAHAQVTAAEAQLNGTVRDQTGSVVAKASITLRNVDTNRVYAAVSNGIGFYILTNIEPGNYELSV